MAKKFKKIKRSKMGFGGDLQKAGVGQGVGAIAGKFYPGMGNIIGSMLDLNLSQIDKLEEAITTPVGRPLNRNTGISYASGGTTKENIPVEVEGGEVIDDGVQVEEVVGADHEEGGVDMDLPEGTDVYSKRVKHPKTGETMAERKKKREIAEQKAAEYLSKKQGDFYAKQTYKRVREANAIQDAEDMAIQEYFKTVEMAKQRRDLEEKEQAQMMQQFDNGSTEQVQQVEEEVPQEEVQELAFGVDGLEEEEKRKRRERKKEEDGDYFETRRERKRREKKEEEDYDATFDDYNDLYDDYDDYFGDEDDFKVDNYFEKRRKERKRKKKEKEEDAAWDAAFNDDFDDDDLDTKGRVRSSYKRTEGDELGYAGERLKGIAPLLTTLTEHLNTEAPKNTAKDFGSEALQEIRGMEGLAGTQYQQALQEVNESTNSFNNSLRNSASSINTLRAMRGMSEKTKEKMVTQAVSRYAQAKNQIAQMKARTLLMKNQMEIQGENRRFDIAEQQRDNFYTNLNEDLVNVGDSLVSRGKNLNREEANTTDLNLTNDIYGDEETSIDQFGIISYGDEELVENEEVEDEKKNTRKTKKFSTRYRKRNKG